MGELHLRSFAAHGMLAYARMVQLQMGTCRAPKTNL